MTRTFPRVARLAVSAIVVALLIACGGTEPSESRPTTITLNASIVALNAFGETRSLGATVLNQNGDSMPQATVTWESSNAAIAEVASSGTRSAVVTARGNGETQVRARSGDAVGMLSVRVAQVLTGMVKTSGDDQVDTVQRALPQPLVATVIDGLGNPVANARVNFNVTAGGGSLNALADTSGANGQVQVNWMLGTSAGTQTVVFTEASGVAGVAVFHATARSGPPVTLTRVAGDSQRAKVGSVVPIAPAVQLHDAFGNPAANVTVVFEPTAGGGIVASPTRTTDGDGIASARWTLGTSAGQNDLLATAPGGLTYTFIAIALIPGPPAALVIVSGNFQVGLQGYQLNFSPAVRVQDTAGIPLDNVEVSFTPSPGGSITGSPTPTDASGLAVPGPWTLHAGSNVLTVSIADTTVSRAHVNATGSTQQFDVDLRFLTPLTPAQQSAFTDARARWRLLIFGDVPDVLVQFPGNTCGQGTPPIDEIVDDLMIFVSLDSIDGRGKILGQAGPCIIRSHGSLPLVGRMRFDTADVADLLAGNQLDAVILHEMAHVLGFTAGIWDRLSLVIGRVAQGGTDPHFIGTEGTAAFDRSGGVTYGGPKVPLENCAGCGGGTVDSHWREAVFDFELMTGFIDGFNSLSVITTAALGDMGYAVNWAASDSYTVPPFAALRAAAPAIELKDDVLHLPITVVDRRGRVLRVIPPR